MLKSGTRHDALLLSLAEQDVVAKVRAMLSNTSEQESLPLLLSMLEKSRDNDDFVARFDDWMTLIKAVIKEDRMAIRHIDKDEKGNRLDFITIKDGSGLVAVLSNYGAHLVSLLVPAGEGKQVDVCLGYDDIAGYKTNRGYLGATVGRYCNRIGGAAFQLNGKTYSLFANDGENTCMAARMALTRKPGRMSWRKTGRLSPSAICLQTGRRASPAT